MVTRRKSKTKPLRLNLACGQRNDEEGWTGVDITKTDAVDVVLDLTTYPWPWDDGAVEEIRCFHFLEHLNGDDRIPFMDEIYRILKVGGTATIVVPYYNGMRSIQDPTHKYPPLAESSFLYFNKGWRTEQMIDHYPMKCDFDFVYGYQFLPGWESRNEETRSYGVAHYTNVVLDLQVVLTKRAP